MNGKLTSFVAILSLSAGSLLPAGSALAQPGDIGDLVDARAPGAESQMQARGYRNTGFKNGGQYWWNAATSTCVRVVVANGRYSSVTKASDSDCGHGGGNAAAAVAGVAAIGLIAALAAHHKDTGDRHRGQANHDTEYERGYNDGLYSAHYSNNDSEGYHEGFMAGEQERANRRHSNTGYLRGSAPRVSLDACSHRADDYQNQPAGSSVPISVYDQGGGQYEVTMATGRYRSRCTVDDRGRVIAMNPY